MKGTEQIDFGIIMLWVLGAVAVLMFIQFMYDLISTWYWERYWRKHYRPERGMFGELLPPPDCRPHKREAGKEKMMGYVARDKDGKLYFFPIYAKIIKREEKGIWTDLGHGYTRLMPPLFFPEVKWEDEKPTEVDVTFRIREEL